MSDDTVTYKSPGTPVTRFWGNSLSDHIPRYNPDSRPQTRRNHPSNDTRWYHPSYIRSDPKTGSMDPRVDRLRPRVGTTPFGERGGDYQGRDVWSSPRPGTTDGPDPQGGRSTDYTYSSKSGPSRPPGSKSWTGSPTTDYCSTTDSGR